jgi:HAD superfamily hydrolase (TIGR01509 family)
MINTVIFDLDGVLVDTEKIHLTALQSSIVRCTGLKDEDILHLLEIDGTTTKSKLKRLQSSIGLSNCQIEDIDRQKQLCVIGEIKKNVFPTDHLTSLLSDLKSSGFTLALASNSRYSNVILILDILGITDFFSVIITADDVISPKPSPEIFLKVIEKLNITPNECLILEDSSAGQQAAIDSGARLLKINSIDDTNLENINRAIYE